MHALYWGLLQAPRPGYAPTPAVPQDADAVCSNCVHASQKIVRYLQVGNGPVVTEGFALDRYIFSCWPPVEDERDNTDIPAAA